MKAIYNYRALFLFFIFTRLAIFLFFEETPSLFINHYEKAAINFLNGDGFSVIYENSLVPFTLYPPGFSFFIAIVYTPFGINPVFVQVAQILVVSIAFILFIKTVGVFFNSHERAIHFGYIYSLIPIFWTFDVSLNTGASLAIGFSLISYYFLYRSEFSLRCFLSGLFIAIAVSIRSEYIILIPVLLFLLFLKSRAITHLGLFMTGCLLVLVPMSIRNYTNFKVLSPLPGGGGLTLINVIGKFYPDYEKGFAFGDGNVLNAEKGNYTDLTYPHPYEREKDRLARSINFVAENPGKFLLVLVRNTPRAWFGHQLNLVHDEPSFQEHLASGGGYVDFIKENPLKFADIFLGFSISIALMFFAVFYIARSGKQLFFQFLPLIVSGTVFLLFFVVFGTLGRYTLPAYVLLSPLSYLGADKALNEFRNFYKK
jgi:hypothetical protein